LRVFLDTNVLVSAFATRGVCADVLRVVLAEHTLVTGEVVLQELRTVLSRRIGLPAPSIREIEELLRDQEVIAKPRARAAIPERDPDDQWIVASAIEGRVDVLVTGDRDLLDLVKTAPIKIVDPRGFWDLVRRTR
jgi:uncharacterized protein